MSELSELYQEVILDHNRRPRNFRGLDSPDRKAEGYNPFCGDRLTVFLRLDGDVVADATFLGAGCAISKASASMMTEAVKGHTLSEVNKLFTEFQAMVTGQSQQDEAALGKLAVFAGVREFPVRVKCASLAWHTLKAAADKTQEPVTTE
jgi:nitrogen fixation NifU-like protein